MTENTFPTAEELDIWNLATLDGVTVYCLGIENYNYDDYESLKQQIIQDHEIVQRLKERIKENDDFKEECKTALATWTSFERPYSWEHYEHQINRLEHENQILNSILENKK